MGLTVTTDFLGSDSDRQSIQGDTARLQLECRAFSGELADPSACMLRIEAEATGEITELNFEPESDSSDSQSIDDDDFLHPSEGQLQVLIPMLESGRYKWRAEATIGGIAAAAQGAFYAMPEDPEAEESSDSSSS